MPRFSVIGALTLCGISVVLSGLLPAQTFTNVTASSGILLPPITAPNSFGRGSCWDDFDGDGDMDLFAPGGGGHGIDLWLNQGNGSFSSQVVQAAVPGELHFGAVSADFDNDGDQDVLLCTGNGANKLFVNQGNATFLEEALVRGITPSIGRDYCASWGDYDRDGWLDLYLGNYSAPGGAPNRLLRSDRDGTFTEVTSGTGAGFPGAALSVVWHDQDRDGWPDLHVANDKGPAVHPNGVLHNKKVGVFGDEAATINANASIDSMGCTVGDMDNDGDWDVFVSNNTSGHVLLEWNASTGGFRFPPQADFTHVAAVYGLQTGQFGWGTKWLDYNNDGNLDLFIMHQAPPNRLFEGQPGNLAFIDATFSTGIATVMPASESCCVIDYDDDGFEDIWMPGRAVPGQLIRNIDGTGNWLKFKLEGTRSNRDAFGTTIICRTLSNPDQMRMKTSGESFLSCGDKRPHFGFGTLTAVVREVEIRWPSGSVSFLHNVPTNQIVSVTEPAFNINGPLQPGTGTLLEFGMDSDGGLPYIGAVVLDTSVETPLGDGRFLRFNIADPVFIETSSPSNFYLFRSHGTLDPAGQADMTFYLPPFPYLTGFPINFVAASVDPNYAWGLKSLIAPWREIIK